MATAEGRPPAYARLLPVASAGGPPSAPSLPKAPMEVDDVRQAPSFQLHVHITEYAAGKPAVPHWFALSEDRPLFAFAGLWRPWTGTRGTKAEPAHGEHELSAFLTCEPNAVVAPVHPKAMPVILTTGEECDAWLAAPIDEALHLQRPLADGLLSIIARGEKQDPPSGSVEIPALLL